MLGARSYCVECNSILQLIPKKNQFEFEHEKMVMSEGKLYSLGSPNSNNNKNENQTTKQNMSPIIICKRARFAVMGAVWGACASPDGVVIATSSVASAMTSAVI